jgi:hypothetical protein
VRKQDWAQRCRSLSVSRISRATVAATERVDVALESNLPATLERVTIPVGKDSAATVIVFKRAGTV